MNLTQSPPLPSPINEWVESWPTREFAAWRGGVRLGGYYSRTNLLCLLKELSFTIVTISSALGVAFVCVSMQSLGNLKGWLATNLSWFFSIDNSRSIKLTSDLIPCSSICNLSCSVPTKKPPSRRSGGKDNEHWYSFFQIGYCLLTSIS